MLVQLLEHAGDVLVLFVGFWRFLLSPRYRQNKLVEWREARRSRSGPVLVALEIVAAVVFGVALPAWLIVVLLL